MFAKILDQVQPKNREGALLLMSLLVMAGLVSAGSSFAIITMQNLRQSSLIDNGIQAYYAAETGVEDALYEIRKNETAIASMDGSGSLSNGGTWSRSITTTVSSVSESIDENNYIYLDLYDPDDSLTSQNIKQLVVTWEGSGSWIEVQIVPWRSTAWDDSNLGTPTTQLYSVAQSPKTITLGADSNVLYRVRIKALYADISSITVTALNESAIATDIPANITLYSTGVFSRTNQVVRATLPHRSPLAGAVNYVLFSEEDLIK